MRLFVYQIINWAINVYVFIIIIRVLLSYGFLPPHHKVRRFVDRVTDPPIQFLRKRWRTYLVVQHMDFTPVVVLLLLLIIKRIFFEMLFG